MNSPSASILPAIHTNHVGNLSLSRWRLGLTVWCPENGRRDAEEDVKPSGCSNLQGMLKPFKRFS
jgi:hypothetical protein